MLNRCSNGMMISNFLSPLRERVRVRVRVRGEFLNEANGQERQEKGKTEC